MFCKNCGSEISDSATICPKCNYVFVNETNEEPNTNNESNSNIAISNKTVFCRTCGSKIFENAVICPKCGCETGFKSITSKKKSEERYGIGFLCGFFLGIIGLIIGLAMYSNKSKEKSTFIKGWIIGIGITIFLLLIIFFS